MGSIDVAVLLSTSHPRTHAENENKCSPLRVNANKQGSFTGVGGTFHASALTQSCVDGFFPRAGGSLRIVPALGGGWGGLGLHF